MQLNSPVLQSLEFNPAFASALEKTLSAVDGGENLLAAAQQFFNPENQDLIDHPTRQLLTGYNQEYLRLIPQFYYYLEAGNELTAKAILERITAVEVSYFLAIRQM